MLKPLLGFLFQLSLSFIVYVHGERWSLVGMIFNTRHCDTWRMSRSMHKMTSKVTDSGTYHYVCVHLQLAIWNLESYCAAMLSWTGPLIK